MMTLNRIISSKLAKDSLIFTITEVLNKSVPLLLLPVLTWYLTPDDYGKLAVFNSIYIFFTVIIGLSIQGAVSINYYKLTKEELATYIGNTFIVLIISFIITVLLITAFKFIATPNFEINYIYIASILAFLYFLLSVNLSLLISEQKPKKYGSFQLIDTILKFVFSILFVVVLTYSWKGRVLGILIGAFISSILSVYYLAKNGYIYFNLKRIYINDALKFGIPLVPHQFGIWLKDGGIIFLISIILTKRDAGLYDVALKFAIILNVISRAFNNAWAPYLYRKLKTTLTIKQKLGIVKLSYIAILANIILAFIITFGAKILIEKIFDPGYHDAYNMVIFLTLGASFQGMYFVVVNYLFFFKKTMTISTITTITAVIQVVLTYILINKNGVLGASFAYTFSYLLNFILIWYFSNKVYSMPWNIFHNLTKNEKSEKNIQ